MSEVAAMTVENDWRKSVNQMPEYYFPNGTEDYHKVTRLFPNFIITDGVKEVAEKCKCWWFLTDMVFASQMKPQVRGHEFQVWELSRNYEGRDAFTATGTDGGIGDNDPKVLFKQVIGFSDFPHDHVRLFFERSDTYMVLMLPCER